MKYCDVLVIEDEQDLREVYEFILRHARYDVCSAKHGEEALDMIKDHRPRLVLLDIFMPVMDGEEFLTKVDKTLLAGTKVIVYSNTSDAELLARMRSLGAAEIVTKSDMSPADLIQLVEKHIGKQIKKPEDKARGSAMFR